MQNPNHAAFKAAKTVTDKRLAAIAIYDAAVEAEEFADWKVVADMLRSVVPTPKAKSIDNGWIDYPIKGRKPLQWPAPRIRVRFADGRAAEMSFASYADKPVNWGRGVRQCISAYRGQIIRICGGRSGTDDFGRHVRVPSIESVELVGTGETFPADVANTETEALRAGRFDIVETLTRAHMEQIPVMSGDYSVMTRDRFVRALYVGNEAELRAWSIDPDPDRVNEILHHEEPEETPAECMIRSLVDRRLLNSSALAGLPVRDGPITRIAA